MAEVQAFISNNSFPTSIEELRRMAPRFDMEQLLGVMTPDEIDDESYSRVSWTAPTWCKDGDIIFYMHSKTAINKITKLISELTKYKGKIDEEEFWFLLNSLRRARTIWNAYGGKIFAVGCVAGGPEYYKSEEDVVKHWRSNIYAPIKSVFVLENPIDASEINSRIKISMTGSITPVFGEDFEYLKKQVISKNKYVRKYLVDAIPQAIPLTKITDDNWLPVLGKYRREYSTIIQFRKYYANYLLKELSDLKGIQTDCLCKKDGKDSAYIDNIIRIQKKYLMVRIVLSVFNSEGIFSRLRRYNSVDEIDKSKSHLLIDDIWKNIVLVIDTNSVYLFHATENALFRIYDLDEVKSKVDIDAIRSILVNVLVDSSGINQRFDMIKPDMLSVDPDNDFDYEIEMDDIEFEDFEFDEIDFEEIDVEADD